MNELAHLKQTERQYYEKVEQSDAHDTQAVSELLHLHEAARQETGLAQMMGQYALFPLSEIEGK